MRCSHLILLKINREVAENGERLLKLGALKNL